jgi:hypothetical protein
MNGEVEGSQTRAPRDDTEQRRRIRGEKATPGAAESSLSDANSRLH